MTAKFEFRLRVRGPETSETSILPEGESTIGRQAGNHIQLDHSLVSRRHASLTCSAEACHITDLKSSNGTKLNGKRLNPNEPTPLAHNDIIQIGPYVLTFEQVPVADLEEVAKPRAVTMVAEPKEAEEPTPAKEKVEEPPEPTPEEEPEPEPIEKAVPAPPPPIPPPLPVLEPADEFPIPPGLSLHSHQLLQFLPGIYHTDFMSRFLAVFESILLPIEWNIDNFDLFLDPGTTPSGFLPWLANWHEIVFDPSWSDIQRRDFLKSAHQIYARRGTRWALAKTLEIYIGAEPEIDDTSDKLAPHTFIVKLPVRKRAVDTRLIEALIDTNKPAHTTYEVKYKH